MIVTPAMLGEIIAEYDIERGRPDDRMHRRLAINLAEAFMRRGASARDAGIMERALYDCLEDAPLVCQPTDFEQYFADRKGGPGGIDPLRIGLPEGISYPETVRLMAVQIVDHISRRIENETGKPDDRRIAVRGIGHRQTAASGLKGQGLAIHRARHPKEAVR